MFPLSAACMLGRNDAQRHHARRHASGIHFQALECSELITSGDIVCEVACPCGDKEDQSQTTYTARKHSGKLMVQGEEMVRKHWVPYFSMITINSRKSGNRCRPLANWGDNAEIGRHGVNSPGILS